MEIIFIDLCILIWMHFITDFVLQNDWMSRNKSSDNEALAAHVFIYHLPFYLFGWQYAIVNAVAHFIIDWISSRITKRLWEEEEVHQFFVIIGADQAVHMTTLIATYWWLIV